MPVLLAVTAAFTARVLTEHTSAHTPNSRTCVGHGWVLSLPSKYRLHLKSPRPPRLLPISLPEHIPRLSSRYFLLTLEVSKTLVGAFSVLWEQTGTALGSHCRLLFPVTPSGRTFSNDMSHWKVNMTEGSGEEMAKKRRRTEERCRFWVRSGSWEAKRKRGIGYCKKQTKKTEARVRGGQWSEKYAVTSITKSDWTHASSKWFFWERERFVNQLRVTLFSPAWLSFIFIFIVLLDKSSSSAESPLTPWTSHMAGTKGTLLFSLQKLNC